MRSSTTRETLFTTFALTMLVACSGADDLPGTGGAGGAIVGQGGATANNGGSAANSGGTSSQNVGGSLAKGGNVNGGATSGGASSGGISSGGTAQGTGGKSTGGNTNGGNTNGGKATGGAATGGTATGGVATGGAATGGKATGGAATGGAATGGVATGGKATGGAATGGAATGGAATGGAATGGATSSGKCPSAISGGTCPPKSCPSGATDCGCYTVPGLSARKKAIFDAGGDSRFLASAMMETERLTSDYTLGDGKSGDAFNAGLCKQNWYMIRQCHPAWSGLGAGDYMTSTAMNSNLALDITVYNECRAKWSESVWFAGHRNGQTGLQTGQAPNLQLFINASKWTQTNLENGHLCDDVRFWVSVPAIVVR